MSNLIIIPDTHGCVEELDKLLNFIGPTSDDEIISLGDITDKGPDPIGVARLFIKAGAKLTASNHDDRYIKFFKDGKTPEQISPNSKAISKEHIVGFYRTLLKKENEDVLNFLLSRKPYIQRTINASTPTLITLLHAGVLPYTDLGNLSGKDYNEIIRCRYVDSETGEFVRLVRNPDGSWGTDRPNVKNWQEVYDGRFGLIVHGHNIVGQTPKVWKGSEGRHIELDELFWGTVEDYDVVSLDTGCHKGWYLTAMIIAEGGIFHFVRQAANMCYAT